MKRKAAKATRAQPRRKPARRKRERHTWTIEVHIGYSIESRATTDALVDECRRCETAIADYLKSRGADVDIVSVSYVQCADAANLLLARGHSQRELTINQTPRQRPKSRRGE